MLEKIKISEIKKGILLCIDNSKELIEDAEILINNNKFPRGYTLTQLALEEIGKSNMLHQFYVEIQSVDGRRNFDYKKFRKKFYNHKWKTFESTLYNLMIETRNLNIESEKFKNIALEEFENIKRIKNGEIDTLKNNSLYVSLNNKTFQKPSNIFTKKQVTQFFKKSKEKIIFTEKEIIKWLEIDIHFGLDTEGIIMDD